jgi:AraC-like DNA-binding protein
MTLTIRSAKPPEELSEFVESYWMLFNDSPESRDVVILPDGRIDLLFSRSNDESFHSTLVGLDTRPDNVTIAAGTLIFSVSFKLPAMEYILGMQVADLIDTAKNMEPGFWGFSMADLEDFEEFCNKATGKIKSLLSSDIDARKQTLFRLIYASDGATTVKELSEKAFWSSRQINRYFTAQYGISLKAYCGILRFRASFFHLKFGKLYPEQNFADQSHFIKEVKKLAGVIPKELSRNKDDRFIQFSVLPEE